MSLPCLVLLLNGAIVLLVGLLAGIPYGAAITGGRPEATVRGWRVAHGALCMGATTMIAVAAALATLGVGEVWAWAVAAPFVASGYGFAVALPLGAWAGHRGLTSTGPAVNRVVFAGNALGAWTSLAGTVALIAAIAQAF